MAAGPTVKNFLERSRAAKKIIVVDFGFLGDSIHLIPALWEIKRHYPAAQLHTLSAMIGAEVLRLAPCVDRAWGFPLTPESPPWWRHWGILRELRRERFDAAFNFSGSDRTLFATAAMGARWTLAHEAGRKHFWNRWLGAEWVERRDPQLPMFEQRRQVLAAAGFTLEAPRFDLRVPPEAAQWAEREVIGRPAHLSINASTPVKEWPLEHWITLAQMFSEQNPPLAMVATAGPSPREVERARQFARAADGAPLRCFEGLSIARLAALLQRCQLHIGADSGVLHLAFALGVPTLGIFRQYADVAGWLPAGREHRHLIADDLASIAPAKVCEMARVQAREKFSR